MDLVSLCYFEESLGKLVLLDVAAAATIKRFHDLLNNWLYGCGCALFKSCHLVLVDNQSLLQLTSVD